MQFTSRPESSDATNEVLLEGEFGFGNPSGGRKATQSKDVAVNIYEIFVKHALQGLFM